MSRIPGASPITTDIEEIRHSGNGDETLVGGDFEEAEHVETPENDLAEGVGGERAKGGADKGASGRQVEAGMRS